MTSVPLLSTAAPTHVVEVRDAAFAALKSGHVAVCVTGTNAAELAAFCDAFGEAADDRTFVVRIVNPGNEPASVLLRVLREVGVAATRNEKRDGPELEAVTEAFRRFLRSLSPLGAQVVLAIGDAHLGSRALYEVLRDLADAVNREGKPLRFVLAGPPVLGDRVSEPPLRDLAPPEAWHRAVLSSQAASADNRGRVTQVLGAVALLTIMAGGAWWLTSDRAAPPPAASGGDSPTTGDRTPAPPSASDAPATGRPTTPAPASPMPPPDSPKPRSASAPDGTATGVAAPPAVGTVFRVTIASFRTAGRAQQIADDLRSRDLEVATRVDASNTWHQVIAGPFTTIEAAQQAQARFAAAGFPDTRISPIPATSLR